MLDKSDISRQSGLYHFLVFNGSAGRHPHEPTTTHHLPSGVGFR